MSKYPKIGDYVIVKLLGKGGMSRVYLAVDNKLEREVAIKILLSALIEDENIKKRFLREAKTAASLRHSNIVSIYDIGETEDENYYFVMEYLSGGSLKEKIKRGKLPPSEALWIAKEIAKALEYAHERGFIHRDIKPANIMFREDGVPVLADFGIAKASNMTTKLTQTGVSVGTPYYMSPEQIEGRKITGKSDIYSLGIVFYEMLTGKVPYDAESTIAIIMKHLKEPIPKLKDVEGVKENSREFLILQMLVNRMMEKDSEKRFSARDVIEFIEKNEHLFKKQPKTDETLVESKKPKKRAVKEKRKISPVIPVVILMAVLGVLIFKTLGKKVGSSSKKTFQEEIKVQSQKSKPPLERKNSANIIKQSEKEIPLKNSSSSDTSMISLKKDEKALKDSNPSEKPNDVVKELSPKEKQKDNQPPEKQVLEKQKENIKEVKQISFEEKLRELKALYKIENFEVFVNKLILLLNENPERRRALRKILKEALLDNKFVEFLTRNRMYRARLKKRFPLLNFPKKEITKPPPKKIEEKQLNVKINSMELQSNFENIFTVNNSVFLFKKKKLYNIKNKKFYSVDSKINFPVRKCGVNYFFTTEFGKLYMIKGGTLKKIFRAKWDINHSPTVKNGKLYVASLDKHVYCFSCSGKLLWKYKSDWEIVSNVAVDDNGNFYFIKKGGYIVSVSTSRKDTLEKKINIDAPEKIYYYGGFIIQTRKREIYLLDENFVTKNKIGNVKNVMELPYYFVAFLPRNVIFIRNGFLQKRLPCNSCFNGVFWKEKLILFGNDTYTVLDTAQKKVVGKFKNVFGRNIKLSSVDDKIFILSRRKLYTLTFE